MCTCNPIMLRVTCSIYIQCIYIYNLRFSPIKILPESGFDLGSTTGESSVLTARLHQGRQNRQNSGGVGEVTQDSGSFFKGSTF